MPAVKRLTPEELQARHDKGLCYNCEEQYQKGHRCKRLFHLRIVTPDEPSDEASSLQMVASKPDPVLVEQEEIDPTPDPAQISLHALMGHSIPQTLRVMGQIRNNPVSTLIDSGSTHNFVQDRVARHWAYPLNRPTPSKCW
jgi:hypothetical protein